MTNPYGITEVDIPGVYGAVQNARMGRMQMMLAQRQVDAADRQAERDNQFRSTLARVFAPQVAQSGSTGGTSGTATGGAGGAYNGPTTAGTPAITPQGVPGANPPATAGAPLGAQSSAVPSIDPAVMSQLIALDPQQAMQIFSAVHQMSEEQRTRLAAANDYIGRFGLQLMHGVPENEWAAEIQRRAPDLMAHGVTQQQIEGVLRDPSRRNVEYIVGQARDMEHVIESAAPHPMVEPPGGRIIDTNSTDPATGAPRVISESPIVTDAQGQRYRRNTPPAPAIGTIQEGHRFKGGDPGNPSNWESVSGATNTGAAPPWPEPHLDQRGAGATRPNFP